MNKLAAIIFAAMLTVVLSTVAYAANINDELFDAVEKNDVQKVKVLILMGADVNTRDSYVSMTPLMTAAYNGYTEIAALLIEKGAEVNAKGGSDMDMTPLIFAMNQDLIDMVKLLIDKGANVNVKTVYGWTPVLFAVSRERIDMLKLLIEKGADVNVKLPSGATALSEAEKKGKTDMVKLLRQAGAK